MAKDYAKMAHEIIEKVGGHENIQNVTHCFTRLRFVLKDESKADTDAVNKIEGVIQVLQTGGQYMVVIGTHVTDVFKVIVDQNLAPNAESGEGGSTGDSKKKTSLLDIISGVLMPVVGAMMATGILKGLLVMFTTLGWMDASGEVYTVLYSAADAFFYFLPLALAITAARKFECNQFVAFTIVATLLYPNLVAAMGAEGGLHFLGMPIVNVTYSNSVIPAVMSVFVLSKLEKALRKVLPELIDGVLNPVICIVVMAPLTLIVIGPAMNWVGQVVADAYIFIYNLNRPIAGMLMAFLWPLLVVMGAHMATFPIGMNNMMVYGYDTMLPVTTGTNYSIAGAVLAIALKSRIKDIKELGLTTGISALVGGVTEPAIYGLVLKYKKPFYICMISTGIGGLIAGIAGAQFPAILNTCIITLPAMAMFPGGWGIVTAAVLGFVGGFVGTYFFGFDDSMVQ